MIKNNLFGFLNNTNSSVLIFRINSSAKVTEHNEICYRL